jgi:hypothetical protein
MMAHDRRSHLDPNVSPNWRPVGGGEQRPPHMHWSDRLFYWLGALLALATIAAGVGVLAYLRWAKLGGALIGIGLVGFALSSPGQAARNGYRSS